MASDNEPTPHADGALELRSDAEQGKQPPASERFTDGQRALLLMATSALLFSLMNFCVRLATAHTPWTLVAASRTFIGALVALSVARMRGASVVVHDMRSMWLRTMFGTCAMSLTFYSLSSPRLPLGDTATLLNLSPLFLAVLTPFFLREPLSRRVLLALPLSLSGVVLILHPTVVFGGAPAGAGAQAIALIALLAAFFSACAVMMLRRLGPTESPEAIALHFSLTATVVFLLMGARTLSLPSVHDLTLMLAAGLSAGLAQIAMTRAYALEQAARVSSVGYLSVVATAMLGALALHEWPSPQSMLGMALVIAGGLVIAIAGIRDQRLPASGRALNGAGRGS